MSRKILFGFLFICFSMSSTPLFAQNYEKEFESVFAWEVKQIDEFIERFNNKDETLIKQYELKNNDKKTITREKLIKSLFDMSSTESWNFGDLNSFIKTVMEKNIYLNFYNKDWYAKVDCSIQWNGKPARAALILKLMVLPDSSSKWVIAGVSSPVLRSATLGSISLPAAADKKASLNPVSHATDFMNISAVTDNIANLKNYFVPVNELNEEGKLFLQECADKRLTIKGANSISYHFLQLDNWIVEVRQFNRQTKNSGWLISKLTKATDSEKNAYRTKQLMQ
ncbi:hypothetical protein [Pedobacter metabolipauper]|uniref:DUF3828 domain-containing protein n=1 Tax=Pedobacter metabolipauper TaxID=425513 RepID=A0A4R6SWE4_9SPHI|nr:hypothetical protein [Pedobacter metabolipauper]TDQ09433.1 hypothetical protein ATK78_1587 [Pedobacter metabolipauper]